MVNQGQWAEQSDDGKWVVVRLRMDYMKQEALVVMFNAKTHHWSLVKDWKKTYVWLFVYKWVVQKVCVSVNLHNLNKV